MKTDPDSYKPDAHNFTDNGSGVDVCVCGFPKSEHGSGPPVQSLRERALAEGAVARLRVEQNDRKAAAEYRKTQQRKLRERIATELMPNEPITERWIEPHDGSLGRAIAFVGDLPLRLPAASFGSDLEVGQRCERCNSDDPDELVWHVISGLRSLGDALSMDNHRHRPGCADQLDEEGDLKPEFRFPAPKKSEPDLRLNDAEQRLVKAIRDVIYNAQPRGES